MKKKILTSVILCGASFSACNTLNNNANMISEFNNNSKPNNQETCKDYFDDLTETTKDFNSILSNLEKNNFEISTSENNKITNHFNQTIKMSTWETKDIEDKILSIDDLFAIEYYSIDSLHTFRQLKFIMPKIKNSDIYTNFATHITNLIKIFISINQCSEKLYEKFLISMKLHKPKKSDFLEFVTIGKGTKAEMDTKSMKEDFYKKLIYPRYYDDEEDEILSSKDSKKLELCKILISYEIEYLNLIMNIRPDNSTDTTTNNRFVFKITDYQDKMSLELLNHRYRLYEKNKKFHENLIKNQKIGNRFSKKEKPILEVEDNVATSFYRNGVNLDNAAIYDSNDSVLQNSLDPTVSIDRENSEALDRQEEEEKTKPPTIEELIAIFQEIQNNIKKYNIYVSEEIKNEIKKINNMLQDTTNDPSSLYNCLIACITKVELETGYLSFVENNLLPFNNVITSSTPDN